MGKTITTTVCYDHADNDLPCLVCGRVDDECYNITCGYVGKNAEIVQNMISKQDYLKEYTNDIRNEAMEEYNKRLRSGLFSLHYRLLELGIEKESVKIILNCVSNGLDNTLNRIKEETK